jgi:hypothetical protein
VHMFLFIGHGVSHIFSSKRKKDVISSRMIGKERCDIVNGSTE